MRSAPRRAAPRSSRGAPGSSSQCRPTDAAALQAPDDPPPPTFPDRRVSTESRGELSNYLIQNTLICLDRNPSPRTYQPEPTGDPWANRSWLGARALCDSSGVSLRSGRGGSAEWTSWTAATAGILSNWLADDTFGWTVPRPERRLTVGGGRSGGAGLSADAPDVGFVAGVDGALGAAVVECAQEPAPVALDEETDDGVPAALRSPPARRAAAYPFALQLPARRSTRSPPSIWSVARPGGSRPPRRRSGAISTAATLPALGHLRVGSVVRADVAPFFHECGRRKPGGANRWREILRSMFGCAIAWGHLARNRRKSLSRHRPLSAAAARAAARRGRAPRPSRKPAPGPRTADNTRAADYRRSH